MSITSSRSVKLTRRPEVTVASSGTPVIEPVSATTSEESTAWTIVTTADERYVITLPGDGRISYGRSPSRDGAEIRFYRNQSTKTYDAVIPNVLMVWSNRVSIEKAPPTEEQAKRESMRLAIEAEDEKRRMEEVTAAIVRREFAAEEEIPF
jgi:hypothetical protein